MNLLCPHCGALGVDDHVGTIKNRVRVRLCTTCNLVFDRASAAPAQTSAAAS